MDRSKMVPDGTLGLALSAAERKLLDNLPVPNEGVVAVVQQTSNRAVKLDVVQLDDLADALSAKANHADDKTLQPRLDTLVRKIDRLTARHLLTLLEVETPGVQADVPLGSQKVASAENLRRSRKKPR
jgi:hypothetical protein